MPKGYWIARIDVDDPIRHQDYVRANASALSDYGGRFLVRGGPFDAVEGGSRSRNVVVEFPSHQAALDCWRSPAYQAALALRLPVSVADLVVIEGYDAPQLG